MGVGVEFAAHGEAAVGCRGADQIDNHAVAGQWLGAPVQADDPAADRPRSAIISTRSRRLRLNRRNQRTHRVMSSRSRWQPANTRPWSLACPLPPSIASARQYSRSDDFVAHQSPDDSDGQRQTVDDSDAVARGDGQPFFHRIVSRWRQPAAARRRPPRATSDVLAARDGTPALSAFRRRFRASSSARRRA